MFKGLGFRACCLQKLPQLFFNSAPTLSHLCHNNKKQKISGQRLPVLFSVKSLPKIEEKASGHRHLVLLWIKKEKERRGGGRNGRREKEKGGRGGGGEKKNLCLSPPPFGSCLASLFALTLYKTCMIFIRKPFRSQVNGANDLMSLTPLTLSKKPSSQRFLHTATPNVIVANIMAILESLRKS